MFITEKSKRKYLLKLTTSMPLETAALQIAEPTNPLPPNTTICNRRETVQNGGEKSVNNLTKAECWRTSAAETHAFSVFTSATISIGVDE